MSSLQLEGTAAIANLLPLWRELLDAKRIRCAGRDGTLAEQGFGRAWARLLSGEPLREVALGEAAHAVAAARLGSMDATWLREEGGLSAEEARLVLQRSFDAVSGPLDRELAVLLRSTLSGASYLPKTPEPAFVHALRQQPRAGATRPGRGRIVLEPAENHAGHSFLVAVGGVLAAPLYGAAVEEPFLTGLTHHLHNATLPDAGDAGDALLGEFLAPLQKRCRENALAELPASLRARAEKALAHVYRAEAPEARAFQTADVLDRVLEMEWHARTAAFTLQIALEEMDIVHPGPVQAFQLEVMRSAALLP